jgi:hypothetical protein
MNTSPKFELVHINHDKPFTDTLVITEQCPNIKKGAECSRNHKETMAVVRQYQSSFEELGTLAFKTRKSGGKETIYAELNEDQAMFLIALFRNSDVVVKFKLRLVKEFRKAINEISRLKGQRLNPDWRKGRNETAIANNLMKAILKDCRGQDGKETKDVHYMAENKLINAIFSGEYKGLNRNNLSKEELHLQTELQRINMMLIAQKLPYQERKQALFNRAALISEQKRLNAQ